MKEVIRPIAFDYVTQKCMFVETLSALQWITQSISFTFCPRKTDFLSARSEYHSVTQFIDGIVQLNH